MTTSPTIASLPVGLVRGVGPLLQLVVVSSHLLAQSAPAQPIAIPDTGQPAAQSGARFEVVSIHAHRSTGDEPSDRKVLPGGRFVATATSVRTLIRMATGIDNNRMSGAPNWIDNETFDVTAITADHAELNTTQVFQKFLLSLLEDRFSFAFHEEEKESSVYWLELNKPGTLGPALRQSDPTSEPGMSTNASGPKSVMKVSQVSMTEVAATLSRQVGRPIEDHTGLKGNFDFQIEWAREESPETTDPSLTTVLNAQLGLKLRPAKGTTKMLIIDRIGRPSAN